MQPPVDFAHSRPGASEDTWESLPDHLAHVAELARRFASAFGSGEWGYRAGLWHDLGKYREEFQRRIRGSREQAPHASTGAAFAAECRSHDLAFVIGGHHAGLANPFESLESGGPLPLRQVIEDGARVLEQCRARIPSDFLDHTLPAAPEHLRALAGDRRALPYAREMWVRLLFSALVDADRLATEAFSEANKRAFVAEYDGIGALRARLDEKLDRFHADTAVNALRARVLADCRRSADHAPGLFSLTVPTGGGKTLASMAFALRHAERYGLRRVIVVVPFTSIIEQNAEVYRGMLGPRNVIEHHSGVDETARHQADAELEVRRRLATENWDAPVVVTTSVQFVETLFASHPSRCRKLHNVVRSVIIVDEAQTLPTEFLLCVLDAIRELVRGYGCSLVLSTATQPALLRRPTMEWGLAGVREIVREPRTLAQELRRVRVHWPPDGDTTPYVELAGELAAHDRVLAIVHQRKDARDLAKQLPDADRFHLSTRMCAAHRLARLNEIKERLLSGGTCRVVSTQLVEAGVDVDFPVVYRALAGIDSLAQAAGRCNRNGTLTDTAGQQVLGDVFVFRAETLPPPGVLRKGLEVTEQMLRAAGGSLDLSDPDTVEEYFRRLYLRIPPDPKGVMPAREAFNFATVARLVRLIDDGAQCTLIVPWGEGPKRLDAFRRAWVPTRELLRALQPYSVQVREHELQTLLALGAIEVIEGVGYSLAPHYRQLYHPEFGLAVEGDEAANPGALIT